MNNLREIQALRRLSPHPGIIKLCEVLYDQPTRRLALVFELMDMNIYELIRGRRHYLPESRIKSYMYQLLKSMDHMHRNGIFHRDIKPENILITDDELKLADFGSCRGIYSKQPYTEYISTRWYRAPECLLTDGFYNYKMDMWGVGCVFFEVLSLYPLFPGTNELDQVTKIHQILGTPSPEVRSRTRACIHASEDSLPSSAARVVQVLAKLKKHSNSHIDFNFPHKEPQQMSKLIPHCSPECVDIIVKLLAYDPDDRLSARQAVKHSYFKEQRAAEAKEKQAQGQAVEGDSSGDPLPQASVGGSGVAGKKKEVRRLAVAVTWGGRRGGSARGRREVFASLVRVRSCLACWKRPSCGCWQVSWDCQEGLSRCEFCISAPLPTFRCRRPPLLLMLNPALSAPWRRPVQCSRVLVAASIVIRTRVEGTPTVSLRGRPRPTSCSPRGKSTCKMMQVQACCLPSAVSAPLRMASPASRR